MITRRLIESLGMNVICARDGLEAVSLYEEHREDIRFVVLDLKMPKMNEIDVFRRLKRISTDVKVIIASGFFNSRNMALIDPIAPAGYIEKPVTLEAVHRLLARTSLLFRIYPQ